MDGWRVGQTGAGSDGQKEGHIDRGRGVNRWKSKQTERWAADGKTKGWIDAGTYRIRD